MITKKQFEAYLNVQFQGNYNMLDPRAMAASGLKEEEYIEIMEKYGELTKKYSDLYESFN